MNQIYDSFKHIPHERLSSSSIKYEEHFDIFNLGVFRVKNTILGNVIDGFSQDQFADEIVELVELQPDSSYRPHYHHQSSAVIYIVLGVGTLILGDKHITYHPGLRIEIPKMQLHGFITETKTLFLSIQTPPIRNPVTGEIDLHYVEL